MRKKREIKIGITSLIAVIMLLMLGYIINNISNVNIADWRAPEEEMKAAVLEIGGNGKTQIDAFEYQDSGSETIIIKDGIRSIGKYAFYNCRRLRSITIPNSVTSIGKDAFYGTIENVV